jgi:short subunit dehydrogenase-like uncharacterized protein
MTWLLYGANGYTGELVARLAVARGERPILAGRSGVPVRALAAELDLPYRVFEVADARDGLAGVDVVAHCAGPFAATAGPVVDACLATGTHYLDITGEVDVFEAVFARDEAARTAGVVLLPGAGFDVVPTDCLAVALARALPGATALELAFLAGGGMSRGTTRSGIEGLATGNLRRVDGALVPTPFGDPSRVVPLPVSGPTRMGAIRWGDLSTAYRSTGIPNITTYTGLPPLGPLLGVGVRLLGVGPLRYVTSALVGALGAGPDAGRRRITRSEVWGEVRDAAGRTRTATLVGPNGYDLTADSVLRAVGFLAAGSGPAGAITPGAHTPGTAFGPDYLNLLADVNVTWPA